MFSELLVIYYFRGVGFISTQAQEKIEKDTYILKGDVIEEGEKTAVGNYENNQKVGKWFFWTTDVLREVDYEDSKIAIVNTWINEDTKVVSNK